MTNSDIRSQFKLAAQLLELHGENSFKIRAYQNIRETISSLSKELSEMDSDEMEGTEGIGKGMCSNIQSLLDHGSFEVLDKYKALTPVGVIEMLGISGFGPKKISLLWNEAGAETLEDVKRLCLTGAVANLKGFAEKSQESLLQAVEFLISCRGKSRYASAESTMEDLIHQIESLESVHEVSETGDYRRRCEILEDLEILVATSKIEETRKEIAEISELQVIEKLSGPFSLYAELKGLSIPLKVRFSSVAEFSRQLIKTTGSIRHLNSRLADNRTILDNLTSADDERSFYQGVGLKFIEPELREGKKEVDWATQDKMPELLKLEDLKGVLHNHSTYSDGRHTLEEMAKACKEMGYEYLGISDHSQTAVYANGLQDFRVKQQQEEIAKLNLELAPFKIFSGIESDILADGSLDYSNEVLSSFDFIVASIHSGLSMDINKATNRLINAVRNPYTTILGHMTGRLILEREGYPVDHKAVIDACAEENVVIEINASPFRLDIDWRWVDYAIDKGVMLSINPDAHKIEGYNDMKYGVLVGRKGGLTKRETLNAMSLKEISTFFEKMKSRAEA